MAVEKIGDVQQLVAQLSSQSYSISVSGSTRLMAGRGNDSDATTTLSANLSRVHAGADTDFQAEPADLSRQNVLIQNGSFTLTRTTSSINAIMQLLRG